MPDGTGRFKVSEVSERWTMLRERGMTHMVSVEGQMRCFALCTSEAAANMIADCLNHHHPEGLPEILHTTKEM